MRSAAPPVPGVSVAGVMTSAPRPLDVAVGTRRVPAVLWAAVDGGAPLVLLGHGGGGHKSAPRQQALARQLVAAGMSVLAIDGPAHGERAPDVASPAQYQRLLVTRRMASVVEEMVEDWTAAVDAARVAGAGDGGLGYLGMSMGTRFGIPLAASLGDGLTCAVFGKFGLVQSPALDPGLLDVAQVRRAAAGVTAPTLWHVQWDDELFPLAGQLELFETLGAPDKRLVAYPGPHSARPEEAVCRWVDFLTARLVQRPEAVDGSLNLSPALS